MVGLELPMLADWVTIGVSIIAKPAVLLPAIALTPVRPFGRFDGSVLLPKTTTVPSFFRARSCEIDTTSLNPATLLPESSHTVPSDFRAWLSDIVTMLFSPGNGTGCV